MPLECNVTTQIILCHYSKKLKNILFVLIESPKKNFNGNNQIVCILLEILCAREHSKYSMIISFFFFVRLSRENRKFINKKKKIAICMSWFVEIQWPNKNKIIKWFCHWFTTLDEGIMRLNNKMNWLGSSSFFFVCFITLRFFALVCFFFFSQFFFFTFNNRLLFVQLASIQIQ